MMRFISVTLSLVLFWLLLSGFLKPWLVGSGIVCSLLVAGALWWGKILDEETHPIHMLGRGLIYWPWLLREMFKSAFTVSELIVHPKLPINPKLVRVKAGQRTATGLVTFANSITLTPGTISARVSSHDRTILVHAIADETTQGLLEGDMDERVVAFEGEAH